MIPEKHYLLTSLAGIMCGFFLESDSLSLLNVNLKVDVDEITVIDQSYPVSKLIRLVLSILYRSQFCLVIYTTQSNIFICNQGRGQGSNHVQNVVKRDGHAGMISFVMILCSAHCREMMRPLTAS